MPLKRPEFALTPTMFEVGHRVLGVIVPLLATQRRWGARDLFVAPLHVLA